MREIEMYKYARKPLEMNAKPGDKILIIADTNTEPKDSGRLHQTLQ